MAAATEVEEPYLGEEDEPYLEGPPDFHGVFYVSTEVEIRR